MVRTALITGGNSGIGLSAAIALRRRGWSVAITARDRGRGEAALERIRGAAAEADASVGDGAEGPQVGGEGGAEVSLIELDLESFGSVRRCAGEALERLGRIDALINNAGINVSERVVTEDGIERTLQVNHFGHFLLTGLLLERVLESDDARVVNVSSVLHRRADGFPLDDLKLERRWGRLYPYASSKLANIMFTRELQRRYGERGLTSLAVHPGGVRTQLGRDGDLGGVFGVAWRAMQTFLLSPQQGAAPVVEAAAEAGMREQGGAYFQRSRRHPGSAASQDAEAIAALWRVSEEVTGAEFPRFDEAAE